MLFYYFDIITQRVNQRKLYDDLDYALEVLNNDFCMKKTQKDMTILGYCYYYITVPKSAVPEIFDDNYDNSQEENQEENQED